MPAHHQTPTLKELADLWPDRIRGIWCTDITEKRRELGWRRADLGDVEDITLPSRDYHSVVDEIISQNVDAIHVFSGMRAYPPITAAFRSAHRQGAKRLALMVESGILWGIKGKLRPQRARWIARDFIPHIQLVLAMGREGVNFYRNAGFSTDVIYPYIYQPPFSNGYSPKTVGETIRLIYIGKFIARKGVDVMLRGLALTAAPDWRLTIVGDDDSRQRYQQLAMRLGLAERIDWIGAIPSDQIPEMLAQHDLCIVPSRFEGWGVVTNEAICAGVPVICSDRVASRELVEYSGAGDVFRSGDPKSLASALRNFLSAPSNIEQATHRAMAYRDQLRPVRLARYLASVFQHRFGRAGERPKPPWVTS